MGSDDVRARAEAVARDLFTNGEPRLFAYLVLRDTPGNQPGEGGSWSERAMADRIAAALAVAPATAQPVAWAVFAEDASVPAYVSASRNRADRVVDSEAGRIEGYRLVPLYAAPPATGDAAAVREACARLALRMTEIPKGARNPTRDWKVVFGEELAAKIRALPLPAPTAVEEARKAFYEACRAAADSHVRNNASMSGTRLVLQGRDMSRTFDALLAAEAEAAATHAAKESRSDDRPAKGQGGV